MFELNVPSMTCSGCANAISRTITAADANAVIKATPQTRHMQVSTELELTKLLTLLENIGHPAQVIQGTP